MNNIKILSLFLTISCIKADVNFDINDLNFNLGSHTLTKQYAPIFQQFEKEYSKAYHKAKEQEKKLLNPTALKIFNNIDELQSKECWQSSWLYSFLWGDNNGYYTNSISCKQLEELQAQSLKDLKIAEEWSHLKPFIQDVRAHGLRIGCLKLIFIINDNKEVSQESKKEKIYNAIDEYINDTKEDSKSIIYSGNITPEAKEWIKKILNPIIEDCCQVR